MVFMVFMEGGGVNCNVRVVDFLDLMDRTTASHLFTTFSSEKEMNKYRKSAAANNKRPVHSAFICREAATAGQLNITIRMHVRRGTVSMNILS